MMNVSKRSRGTLAVLVTTPLWAGTAVFAQDFTYSSDAGAILRFQRDPNLDLNGTICAPSDSALCDEYRIKGTNAPGTLTLEIEGKDGGASTIVSYERIRSGIPEGLDGYSVWNATSPDAPDFLKSFRAPITKSDPTTDKYLRGWGGVVSKLLDIQTYAEMEKLADEIYAERGYPIKESQAAPIVVSRQNAALWEALTIRSAGTSPEITNFTDKFQNAVVATDKQTILASYENQAQLTEYSALSDLNNNRPGTGIIVPNFYSIRAKVVSIFDDYLDSSKRNSVVEIFDKLFVQYMPDDGCKPLIKNEKTLAIECITHTVKYSPKMDGFFVSSLFILKIGAVEDNHRDVVLMQKSLGGSGKIDAGPPSPQNFKVDPESNADVAYVEKGLRNKIRLILSASFQGINVGDM